MTFASEVDHEKFVDKFINDPYTEGVAVSSFSALLHVMCFQLLDPQKYLLFRLQQRQAISPCDT